MDGNAGLSKMAGGEGTGTNCPEGATVGQVITAASIEQPYQMAKAVVDVGASGGRMGAPGRTGNGGNGGGTGEALDVSKQSSGAEQKSPQQQWSHGNMAPASETRQMNHGSGGRGSAATARQLTQTIPSTLLVQMTFGDCTAGGQSGMHETAWASGGQTGPTGAAWQSGTFGIAATAIPGPANTTKSQMGPFGGGNMAGSTMPPGGIPIGAGGGWQSGTFGIAATAIPGPANTTKSQVGPFGGGNMWQAGSTMPPGGIPVGAGGGMLGLGKIGNFGAGPGHSSYWKTNNVTTGNLEGVGKYPVPPPDSGHENASRLRPGWGVALTENNLIYYYDKDTGKSTWKMPQAKKRRRFGGDAGEETEETGEKIGRKNTKKNAPRCGLCLNNDGLYAAHCPGHKNKTKCQFFDQDGNMIQCNQCKIDLCDAGKDETRCRHASPAKPPENLIYNDEASNRLHNPQGSMEDESLDRLSALPSLFSFSEADIPKRHKVQWEWNKETRVLKGDFQKCINEISDKDLAFIWNMMERDDIVLVMNGLLTDMLPKGENAWELFKKTEKLDTWQNRLHKVSKYVKDSKDGSYKELNAVYYKTLPQFCAYMDHVIEGKGGSFEFTDSDGEHQQQTQQDQPKQKQPMKQQSQKLRQSHREQKQRQQQQQEEQQKMQELNESENASNDDIKLECLKKVNTEDEKLYLIDVEAADLKGPLSYDSLKKSKLLKQLQILPGEEKCLLENSKASDIDALGPNLYIADQGAYTGPHQDGLGTVDSMHACLSGYNEVIILKRLPENHKKKASKMMGLDQLYGTPHSDCSDKDSLRNKHLKWLTRATIDEMKSLGYFPTQVIVGPGQLVFLGKGRMHGFRKVDLKESLKKSDCFYQLRKNLIKTLKSTEEFENIQRLPCISVAWDFIFTGNTARGFCNEMRNGLECQRINSSRRRHEGSLGRLQYPLLNLAKHCLKAEKEHFYPGLRLSLEYIHNKIRLEERIIAEYQTYQKNIERDQKKKRTDQKKKGKDHDEKIIATWEFAEQDDLVDYVCSFCQGELTSAYMQCRRCKQRSNENTLACAWCLAADFNVLPESSKHNKIGHGYRTSEQKGTDWMAMKRSKFSMLNNVAVLLGDLEKKCSVEYTKRWWYKESQARFRSMLDHKLRQPEKDEKIFVFLNGETCEGTFIERSTDETSLIKIRCDDEECCFESREVDTWRIFTAKSPPY